MACWVAVAAPARPAQAEAHRTPQAGASQSLSPCAVEASWAGRSPGSRPMQADGVEERGVKSWMVKKAARLLADAIRYGRQAVYYVIKDLDGTAAKAFQKHAGRIADGLDDIAKIPDLTPVIVKEKVIYFMANTLKMRYGTAQVIGEAIYGALWVFL